PRFRTLVIELKKWARSRGIPTNVPWRQLTAEQRRLVLEGDPENDFDGVKGFFTWLERKKYKLHVRVFLTGYRGYATCPDCSATRSPFTYSPHPPPRRALRSRQALNRPTPTRHAAPDRPPQILTRPRQHCSRRRARPRHHQGLRPHHRSWPSRGRTPRQAPLRG